MIKDTFALNEVPKEALYVGLAGVLPYMATSLSTVYLAFDINHAQDWGTGFIFSSQYAELLLHAIEPIQIGYGAVVCFLSMTISESVLIHIDHILLGCHSLGPRMGEIRRLSRLPALCIWCSCSSRRMAHAFHAG